MEQINFLDPDYKKKRKYNNHLSALIKVKDQLNKSDILIVSEFFERKILNQRTKSFENRVFLLSVAGSIRSLFRLFAFAKVEKDLRDQGIILNVPKAHLNKIKNEFNRRNRSKNPFIKKPKSNVTVEYKRRKNV